MKILKLAKPLLVNGKKRTELKYDTSILTISDLSNAETLKFKLVPAEQVASSVAQTDNILHLCVAVMTVLRCEPEVSEEDMLRLKDLLKGIEPPTKKAPAKETLIFIFFQHFNDKR